jgi:quercetin dioxygenase-like cupin family protein
MSAHDASPHSSASPHYSISGRQAIIETPEVRVTLMTLGPGEATPWHSHSEIADTAFRLDGEVEVQAKGPDGREEALPLLPGQPCRMEPGRVHRVVNAGQGPCRFLLVQGVGAYDFRKA